jgi:uncharacterized protein (TIGR03437 family)
MIAMLRSASLLAALTAVFACSLPLAGQGFLVTGAGYLNPAPVAAAPCQLATLYTTVPGISETTSASALPLPHTLAGISAKVIGTSAAMDVPILAVYPAQLGYLPGLNTVAYNATAVTIEVPCEIPVGAGSASLAVSGPSSPVAAVIYLSLASDAIHVIRNGDSLTGARFSLSSATYLPPAITHADGSLVSATNPAKIGETVSIWAIGLGLPSSGSVATGAANPNPPLTTQVNVDFDFRPNAGPGMPWSGAAGPGDSHVPAISVPAYFAPGYVGLYQINITIPAAPVALQPCGGVYQSNVTVNIGGQASFDGAGICVARN